MAFTEEQLNNIYAMKESIPVDTLLKYLLDRESGVTIENLSGYSKMALLQKKYYERVEDYFWNGCETLWKEINEDVQKRESGLTVSLDVDKLERMISQYTEYRKLCGENLYRGKFLEEVNSRLSKLQEKKKEELIRQNSEKEEKDWVRVKGSNDVEGLNEFIANIYNGIYSKKHLSEAENLRNSCLVIILQQEWETILATKDTGQKRTLVDSFVNKYRNNVAMASATTLVSSYLSQAQDILLDLDKEQLEADWMDIKICLDLNDKKAKLSAFIAKYNQSDTGISRQLLDEYREKAQQELESINVDEEAQAAWLKTKREDEILAYVEFIEKYPRSSYCMEAELAVNRLKTNLLADMKSRPFEYNRMMMNRLITTKTLTWDDLVGNNREDGYILTDRGYNHIQQYPTLQSEQRELPLSKMENPVSESGNTDVYFFGITGSGKTCVLAGLLSLSGLHGFKFDPRGQGGGGNYAMELQRYARKSMLPPGTKQDYIQVIDATMDDERGQHKLSLIEMSGEKTARFALMDHPESLDDLGPGAAALLSNGNRKLFFFVIDPTNSKDVEMGIGTQIWVQQSSVLECVASLLKKDSALLDKIVGIHVILTKSDTLKDLSKDGIMNMLTEQGYASVLSTLKDLCLKSKNKINYQNDYKIGIYPYCLGRFMPGDVYTFDDTDAVKMLRVIQQNTEVDPNSRKSNPVGGNPWKWLKDWLNS